MCLGGIRDRTRGRRLLKVWIFKRRMGGRCWILRQREKESKSLIIVVVPITDRKRGKCAQDLCRKQGRLEGIVPSHQEGPKGGADSERNSKENHRRRVPVQVHGMQRPDSKWFERSL